MSFAAVYLDIYIGHREEHARAQVEYDATSALLAKHAAIYGLPESPADLSDEQQDILQEIDVRRQPSHHAGLFLMGVYRAR